MGMLPTILINLFIGYTIPFIDNAAHLGGLAAGMLFALFVGYKRPGERGSVAVTWHALQIISLALVVAGFGEVARHFETERHNLAGIQSAAQAPRGTSVSPVAVFITAINDGQVGYHAALEKGDADAATNALLKIDAAHAPDAQSDLILKDLRILVVRAHDYAALAPAERNSPRGREARKKIEADFDVWNTRSDNWVKTEGAKYGITLDENDGENNKSPQGADEKGSAQKNSNK
jgi:hypothetical protein